MAVAVALAWAMAGPAAIGGLNDDDVAVDVDVVTPAVTLSIDVNEYVVPKVCKLSVDVLWMFREAIWIIELRGCVLVDDSTSKRHGE